MFSPLDLKRMASRIERLQQTSTHDWLPGDDLEFKNLLPGGRDRRALPMPAALRQMADAEQSPTGEQWRLWLSTCQNMEHLQSRNRPGSVARMMHDMRRGRLPGMR